MTISIPLPKNPQFLEMPKTKRLKKTLDPPSSPNPRSEMEEEEEAAAEPEPSQELPLASPRRKTKKKAIPKKKQAMINEKLLFLTKSLNPQPFRPSPQTLAAIALHEPLFRSLGLWDFAHLQLDPSPRRDLLDELLARFDPSDRCSYVFGARVNVTRPHLARALSLPVKKDKPPTETPADPLDASAESALLEFILDGMVFLEDAAEVPAEVVQAQRLVREGRAGWVDWAGLVWAMVEKEMVEAPRTGVCYYASHLQCLIRFQKPKLFEKEDEAVPEEEMGAGEEDNAEVVGDPGLSLGVEETGRGVEENVEDGVHDELASKFPSLERTSSVDLMHAIGNGDSLSFNLEQSNAAFLAMENEMHKSMQLDHGPESSSFFGNEHDRTVEEIGNGENVNVHGFPESNQQKNGNIRSDVPWENTQSVLAFDGYIGDVQNLMGNAKMILVEKEKAFMNARLQLQYLNGMMQQKEEIIQSLERTMMQEQQKRHVEAFRLEHELRTLSNVLFDYKKALKGTRDGFAEYRAKFRQVTEPVRNSSGVGTGGVVLGTEGLESICSAKKEEICRVAEELINGFEESWHHKLDPCRARFSEYEKRLAELHGKVKILKGRAAEAKDRKCG